MIRLIVILLVASGCCLHCAADASPRTGRSLLQVSSRIHVLVQGNITHASLRSTRPPSALAALL